MQLAADLAAQLRAPAIAQIFLPRAAVFPVADDGMPQLGHMRAQLMCAPGDRHQRAPADSLREIVEHRVIGGRALGALGPVDVAGVDGDHLFALAAAPVTGGLDQAIADRAHARLRHARDGGPIDLAGGAGAEGFRQRPRHAVGPRQQQQTGGVLVQAMDQLGLVLVAKAQRRRQPVDMPIPLPRAALRGQPRRLVEGDDVLVLPDHRLLDHLGIRLGDPGAGHGSGRRRVGQGRDADLLPGLDPGIGAHPAAIDAQLSGAAHLFDSALRKLRKFLFQPAVEALIAVIRAHAKGLHRAHVQIPLPMARPAITAASDSSTDPAT